MTNGQLNVTLIPSVTQMVTLEPSTSNGATIDGVQQNCGDFAGMLSGMQSASTVKTTPDAGQVDLLQIIRDKAQIDTGAAADGQVADLLVQLHVSALITPALAPAKTMQADSEKTDVAATTAPLSIEPSDATSQMVLAAYSQPGRMPTADIQTHPPADLLQNVAVKSEQTGEKTVPVVKMHTDQAGTEQSTIQSATVAMPQNVAMVIEKPAVNAVSVVKIHTDQAEGEQKTIKSVAVAMQQNVATVTEKPAVYSAPVVKIHTDQTAVEQIQPQTVGLPVINRQSIMSVETEMSQPAAMPQTLSARASSVSIPPLGPVDRLQNVADLPDMMAPPSVSPDAELIKQSSTEVVQTLPREKPAAVLTLQSEQPSIQETVAAPASSPETELEIQLSQPQAITARVATISASVDNRFAIPIQEGRGTKLRQNPEQQIEKVRTGGEQGAAKDVPALLQPATTGGEPTQDSDTSRGNENNQGQPDAAVANQLLEQQMRGQLRTDNQKVAPFSTKAVTAEPVRQDVPEQVMQQVKERLVQHDVKPGNQQITLTLSPDNLGELKMNLNLQGQKLSVEIIAENRTVRDAILQHTDTLKETLARQNITMESFDVTTGGKGSGNQSPNQNAWRELAKQQQLWTAPRGYQTAQAELPSSSAAYQKQQGHTMLDIHY